MLQFALLSRGLFDSAYVDLTPGTLMRGRVFLCSGGFVIVRRGHGGQRNFSTELGN